MENSLFCSFNSQIYDVLVAFDVIAHVPYFVNFFLSSILESFEEHRGSMLMIKIDNRLPKLGVDILFLFSFQGMQVEGIYRVNGNQADIGLIEQKIEESEFENQLQ